MTYIDCRKSGNGVTYYKDGTWLIREYSNDNKTRTIINWTGEYVVEHLRGYAIYSDAPYCTGMLLSFEKSRGLLGKFNAKFSFHDHGAPSLQHWDINDFHEYLIFSKEEDAEYIVKNIFNNNYLRVVKVYLSDLQFENKMSCFAYGVK